MIDSSDVVVGVVVVGGGGVVVVVLFGVFVLSSAVMKRLTLSFPKSCPCVCTHCQY